MDSGVATIIGAAVGAAGGIVGGASGAWWTIRRQEQARIEGLIAGVIGAVEKYKEQWKVPGAEFYARCVEIERRARRSEDRAAARRLMAAANAAEATLDDILAAFHQVDHR